MFGALSHSLETSTHLSDLKALTHDVLYEYYRTEKLSRSVTNDAQYVLCSRFPRAFVDPLVFCQ